MGHPRRHRGDHTGDRRHLARRKQRTPEAQAWQWFYSSAPWLARRAYQLRTYPLCQRCKNEGRITSAEVVHHTTPHKGDWELFIHGPVESLCKHCHDSIEQSFERTGIEKGNAADGSPTDKKHPWNK